MTITAAFRMALPSQLSHPAGRVPVRVRVSRRARRLALQLDRKVQRITVRDTTTRWGSCSANGNLAFSWRLIMAPEAVLHYVVAHEVGHLLEMNHGPRFWKLVDRLVPNVERQRDWLNPNRAWLLRIGGTPALFPSPLHHRHGRAFVPAIHGSACPVRALAVASATADARPRSRCARRALLHDLPAAVGLAAGGAVGLLLVAGDDRVAGVFAAVAAVAGVVAAGRRDPVAVAFILALPRHRLAVRHVLQHLAGAWLVELVPA